MAVVDQGVRPPGRRHPDRLARLAPTLTIAAVALAARLTPVLRGGGLRGVLAYDDGVYYSASDALLSGRLPYRDYLLLHPPGITLVLAPFAALGRLTSDPVGFAAARLAFMGLGAVSAVLVWWVARRVTPRAGLAAGLFYAVWQPASYAERTTLLEPLVNLGLLASLALLAPGASRRRVAAAGVVLGLAVAAKAWAVVPFVVLTLWLLRRRGRGAALTYAGVRRRRGRRGLPAVPAGRRRGDAPDGGPRPARPAGQRRRPGCPGWPASRRCSCRRHRSRRSSAL